MNTKINPNQNKGSNSNGLGNGSEFLVIGKHYNPSSGSDTGDTPFGNVFKNTGTNRIYVTLDLISPSSNQFGICLRIFKNDYGSYYMENDGIIVTRAMLTDTNTAFSISGQDVIWTTDQTYLYAAVRYTKTSGGNRTRIDFIRFDLDGSNPVATNIYDVASITNTQHIQWENSNHNTMAACVVGTQLFITWSEVIAAVETDQIREYTISGTTYTLANTYTRSGMDNAWGARSMTYDSNTSTFYFSGGSNGNNSRGSFGMSGDHIYIEKYTISGSNFTLGSSIFYNEFDYQSNSVVAGNNYNICFLEFSTSSYTIYGLQSLFGTTGGSPANVSYCSYWLQTYEYPLF